MHWEGAATGIHTPRRRRPAYWFDSRRRFFARAHGVLGLVVADVLWALGRGSLLLRRRLGLGGRAAAGSEPERLGADLLLGDWRALLGGQLHRARRSIGDAHGSA